MLTLAFVPAEAGFDHRIQADRTQLDPRQIPCEITDVSRALSVGLFTCFETYLTGKSSVAFDYGNAAGQKITDF